MNAIDIAFSGLYADEVSAFDCYFASLASLQVHPGAGTKENKPMTLVECKNMAHEMLKIRRALILQVEA